MSDEVTDFLRSVEQLKDRRQEEDDARSRELEQKILQEKRERQARRAERARSISPQKSSPANTPPPSMHHRYDNSQTPDLARAPVSPPLQDSPTSRAPQKRQNESTNNTANSLAVSTPDGGAASLSSISAKENISLFDSDIKSPASSLPVRAPTLSWQRRPAASGSPLSGSPLSSDLRPKGRPLSMVATENAAARSSVHATPSAAPTASPAADSDLSSETPVSRDNIAQALSAKDPSWFRQTPDRGLSSAAYRRSQVEDNDRQDLAATPTHLPGLAAAARPLPSEPEISAAALTSPPASLANSGSKLRPALPLTPTQRLDPPVDAVIASPLSGRSSPTRPRSPTKGVGGFVQSAMMKRSDSVKRWSVTSPQGLQRGESMASLLVQPSSPTRPASSHGRDPVDSSVQTPTAKVAAEPAPTEQDETHTREEDKKTTPPSSPSKTMDPRRWSPTKSSWLEAALNKPESPKHRAPAFMNNQPAWMVELNKSKAQKATNPGLAEATQPPTVARKHEVKTGGLMRSTPMGATAMPSPPVAISRSRGATTGAIGAVGRHSPSVSVGSISDRPVAASGSPGKEPAKEIALPKSDLRAGPKPWQPLPAGDKEKEGGANELHNVFGTLRRVKTQNFVAPDILKDNVLRGKNALVPTGGPKPRERKDELKDAILQKKAQFDQAKSTGRGVATNAHAQDEKPELPEGVAKRLEMSRTGGSRSVSPQRRPSVATPASSETTIRHSGSLDFSRSKSFPILSAKDAEGTTTSSPQQDAAPPVVRGQAAGSPRMGEGGGGALNGRFHPDLAGLLARGPPAAGAPNNAASPPGSKTLTSSAAPELTHMTKSRARGPKRRAPSSLQSTTKAAPEETKPTVLFAEKPKEAVQPMAAHIKTPPAVSPKNFTFAPRVASFGDTSGKLALKPSLPNLPGASSVKFPLVDTSKKIKAGEAVAAPAGPVVPVLDSTKTLVSRPRSPSKIQDHIAALAAKSRQSGLAEAKIEESPASRPLSPNKLNVKRISKFLEESAKQGSVSASTADMMVPRPLSPSKTGGAQVHTSRPLSPQKTGGTSRPLPAPPIALRKKEWQPASAAVSATATPAVLQTSPIREHATAATRSDDTPARSASRQLQPEPSPTDWQRVRSPSPRLTPAALSPTARSSPARQAQEISVVLKDFFGASRPGREFRVDTGSILSKRPHGDTKVDTIQAQLFLVSGDGRKRPVASQFERILFESEMYLCPHSFTDDKGKRINEVYFWVGDEVPEAMAEDAQLFLHNEARAFGGKLIKLRQGKESAEFLQALGGVVMFRRGASTQYDSLAANMLCGRRFLGQITFDEVDFAPRSLCSGFPYLITHQGKCYLWKGKGSNIDELSCARLLGMDMALTGEIIEVEDGNEADSFWDLFDTGRSGKVGSADHWRLKPKYSTYTGRLFHSDPSHRQQMIEIHPFDQRDMSPDGIYVLDAFFEIYIIVGQRSQTQYAAFHNALEFAQEYAILAASMEDRPFVPTSTVVLEGIPRDLKSVFRKWRDSASPTRTAVGGNTPGSSPAASPHSIKRGRSLRIVPLSVALQALAE